MGIKKERSKLVLVIFLMVIIVALVLVSLNLVALKNFIQGAVEKYEFSGIFVFSILADLLEQPIGPEVPASIGALFGLNVVLVLVFSIAGSYIGSTINFYIGKGYLFHNVKDFLGHGEYKRYSKMFEKHRGFALALAAISPIPWVTFCWLAGAFEMKFRQFFIYGLIPRAFRISVIVLVVKYVPGLLF